jgi:hypothetical protein
MAMTSVWCPVLGGHVTQVTDLEGNIIRVICAEYEESNGSCRRKLSAREGGPLAQLLERLSEGGLDTRSTTCVLRSA